MSHARMASSDYLFTWCILIWKQARNRSTKKAALKLRDKFLNILYTRLRAYSINKLIFFEKKTINNQRYFFIQYRYNFFNSINKKKLQSYN